MKRPEISYEDLKVLIPGGNPFLPMLLARIEVQIKYEGYIRKQEQQIAKFAARERRLPEDSTYENWKVYE